MKTCVYADVLVYCIFDNDFNCYPFIYFRVRKCEEKKYALDMDEEGDYDIKDFNISPRALATMRHFNTVELPPAFIHSLDSATRTKGVKYLKCEAFKLQNTFPNNIALLSGNRVMFCIDFHEHIVDSELSTFSLEGFVFSSVRPAFSEPESSAQIGLFKVSKLDLTKIHSESGINLESKCFIFPRGADVQLRPTPEIDPLPEELRSTVKSYVLASDAHAKEAAKCSIFRECTILSNPWDYWWVHSIVIPGRYPNFGQ